MAAAADKKPRILNIDAEPIVDLPPVLARFHMSELYYIRIVRVRDENKKEFKGVVIVSARYMYLGNFDGGMTRALNHTSIREIIMADVKKKKLMGGTVSERQYLIKAECHDVLFTCYAGESKNGVHQDIHEFERIMKMISAEMSQRKMRHAPIHFEEKTGEVSETDGLLPLASLVPSEGYMTPMQRLQQHRQNISFAEQLPKLRQDNESLTKELAHVQNQAMKLKEILDIASKEGTDAALKKYVDECKALAMKVNQLAATKASLETFLVNAKKTILEKTAVLKDETENKEHYFNLACEEEASVRYARYEEDAELRRKQQQKKKAAEKEKIDALLQKLTAQPPRPWSNPTLKEKDEEFLSLVEKLNKIQNQRRIEEKFKETLDQDRLDIQRKLLTSQAALQLENEKLKQLEQLLQKSTSATGVAAASVPVPVPASVPVATAPPQKLLSVEAVGASKEDDFILSPGEDMISPPAAPDSKPTASALNIDDDFLDGEVAAPSSQPPSAALDFDDDL